MWSFQRVATKSAVFVPPTQVPELAARLRPAALAAYNEALKAVFAAGGEQRRRRREALGRAVEDAWQRLQLHSHGTQVPRDVDRDAFASLSILSMHSPGLYVRAVHPRDACGFARRTAGGNRVF